MKKEIDYTYLKTSDERESFFGKVVKKESKYAKQ